MSEIARIMNDYGRAWETHDTDLVASLFTEDATYQENPFNAPMAGHGAIRRYWEEATGQHRGIQFRWKCVIVSGELHVVEWEADFTRGEPGRRFRLRGVMLLELSGGQIARLREYWHRAETPDKNIT